MEDTMRASSFYILMAVMLILAACADSPAAAPGADLDKLVGQPADIASSAYQYRADRKAEENAPESWLALMRYANQPLNKPVDLARRRSNRRCADCSGRRSARCNAWS